LPTSTLSGEANLLIMPNLEAASAAYNLVKAVSEAVTIGPILIGPRRPAHILNASVTARGIVNMSAVACVDALARGAVEAP
jgi:malate dehydrogenase (oxaloacetate-decarboxylating)(NADP+)